MAIIHLRVSSQAERGVQPAKKNMAGWVEMRTVMSRVDMPGCFVGWLACWLVVWLVGWLVILKMNKQMRCWLVKGDKLVRTGLKAGW